jgi:hypothetical protein
MSDSTVPTPADNPVELVGIPLRFLPLLEQAAARLLATRGGQLHEGIHDGEAPRHVTDLLIGEMLEAVDVWSQVARAGERDEPLVPLSALRLVGWPAVADERQRLALEWEQGADDLRALAQYTTRLADLDDLLALADLTPRRSDGTEPSS